MLSDEEKDNVFKISVPIITNEELERLDYTIESDLDNIVHQISETVSRDKDIIILKKVIEKQSKEIEELKDINKKLEARKYMLNAITGEVTAIPIDNNYISKDKIKAKIEEVDYKMIAHQDVREAVKAVLQSLLEKE